MRNAGFTTFCGLDSLLRSVRCEDKNPQDAREILPSFLLSPISLAILVLAKFFRPTLLLFSLFFITSVPVVGIVLLSSQTLHMGPGNQDSHRHTQSFRNSRVNPNILILFTPWALHFLNKYRILSVQIPWDPCNTFRIQVTCTRSFQSFPQTTKIRMFN